MSDKCGRVIWRIGDVVSMCRWDATVPASDALGACTIVDLYPARSQSGMLATVRTLRGWEVCGLDVAWLESPDCTCPILDGVQVTGSSCPVHGLRSCRLTFDE